MEMKKEQSGKKEITKESEAICSPLNEERISSQSNSNTMPPQRNGTNTLLSLNETHTPPFPYFGSVYMTLLSIIQSMIFASLTFPCLKALLYGKHSAILYFPLIVFAIILWHKYVNHHQFLGWQLTPMDTLIVVCFGIVQAIGAFVVSLVGLDGNWNKSTLRLLKLLRPIDGVLFIVAIGMLLGVLAYASSGSKASSDYVRLVVKEHFKKRKMYRERAYSIIIGFEVRCIRGTLVSGLILLVIALLNWFMFLLFQQNNWMPAEFYRLFTLLPAVLSMIVLVWYMLTFDLYRALKAPDSEERLRQLGDMILSSNYRTKLWWWLVVVGVWWFLRPPSVNDDKNEQL